MSKISLEIYNDACEIASFSKDNEYMLTFQFPDDTEGYVTVGDAIGKLERGVCSIDTRSLENDSYAPNLILDDVIIALPQIKKLGKAITILPVSDEYTRDASRRERMLEGRVSEVEARLEEISERVYGTTIF